MENKGDPREGEIRSAPLPPGGRQARVAHEGARIWCASYGAGPPVIMLHGGLGNGEDWGNQVAALVAAGHRVILIESRGHGRSSRDERPFSYELMASDVLAVMDALGIDRAAVAGWSDGAILGLILAMKSPARVTRVFAFGGNMDLGGVKDFSPAEPAIAQAFARAAGDYARLSETPQRFKEFSRAIGEMMRTQPNYKARDLAGIAVPVAVVFADGDEFIKRAHAEYLARSIPGAQLVVLDEATHFAPLTKPRQFNAALLAFLEADRS